MSPRKKPEARLPKGPPTNEVLSEEERLADWRRKRLAKGPLNTPKGKYDWSGKKGKADGK